MNGNWECSICTFIAAGDTPPEVCPFCGTPEEQFHLTEKDPTPSDRAG